VSTLLLEAKFAPKDVIGVDVDPIKNPGQFSFESV
jgi:ATP-dependent Clp protease ATP-binding subunit ClpB